VYPVRYELGFHIPEDDILHGHLRENVKCYRCVPLSPQHGASSGCGEREGLQQWRIAANMVNKQKRTNDKGRSFSWGWAWED
jgi:hypothetical protein